MMNCIDKMYQGIIWIIKNKGYSREAIIDFMHEYTNTPKEYYTDYIFSQIMEQTMIEAVRYALYPSSIISDYFCWKKDPWNYNEFEAICAALGNIKVREKDIETGDYYYINGFSEVMEEFE